VGTAEVRTDLLDYAPGQTVVITGSGWQPGERVALVLTEEPPTHDPTALSAVADDTGSFTNTEFSPEEHDVGVAFTLTATGQSSGSVAQAVFWDSEPSLVPECDEDLDCDDGDACNTDTCTNRGKCVHSGGGGNLGTAVVTSVTANNGGCVHRRRHELRERPVRRRHHGAEVLRLQPAERGGRPGTGYWRRQGDARR
jgi:hypothetical protein